MIQHILRALSISTLGLVLFVSAESDARSRIKDITEFEGVRDNMLVGYGLVVGLNGTGDSLRNSTFTAQSLESMLERLGVSTRGQNINTKNVAAVMVTATLPPFARHGSRVDIAVSALGDAKSLLGGTLLVTPLHGADGEVYAVAQGALTVGGFAAEGEAESIVKGVPTSARIASGAIVEREIGFELDRLDSVKIALHNPDFTTASRIAAAINGHMKARLATARDSATVELAVPATYQRKISALLTQIEQLPVEPDQPAKVLIDEGSGIIVMGSDVRIDEVAVAQGNLTVRVTETPEVVQPEPFSDGETVAVPRTEIEVNEATDAKLAVLPAGVSLQDLVTGLNALGVSPRDLIGILQAIKAAGALQAEIEVM